MPPTAAFVLGVLTGLAVGALVVAGLLRSVGRLIGATTPRETARVVLDGLVARPRRDGVAVQRALARRVRHTGGRTAAGGTVAATHLDVHVGPQDFTLLQEAMGLAAAGDDLAAYYASHARRQGWTIGRTPTVEIVRDISLRPGQAFARPTVRPVTGAVPVARQAPTGPVPAADAVTDVLPRAPADASPPDVLPRLDDVPRTPPGASPTAVLPTLDGADDLVIVHGTDVRTIPVAVGRASIGRGAHNDLVIERPGVARDHVVVEHRADGWWIVPGTAQHGTLFEGRPLERPVLLDGQASLTLGRGVRLHLSAA